MKINKLFILPTLLIAMNVCGQPAFDRLEASSGITTLVISQKMLQVFSKIDSKDADAKKSVDIANKLESMKVFSTDNAEAVSVMRAEVQQYVRSTALSELMHAEDKSQNAKFYIKGGKDANRASELLMVVGPFTNTTQMVILSLTDDVDLSKLGVLAKGVDLPQEIRDIK